MYHYSLTFTQSAPNVIFLRVAKPLGKILTFDGHERKYNLTLHGHKHFFLSYFVHKPQCFTTPVHKMSIITQNVGIYDIMTTLLQSGSTATTGSEKNVTDMFINSIYIVYVHV